MKAILGIVSLLLLIGCSEKNSFDISGSIAGAEGAQWVYLQKVWSEEVQMDSARVKNERFHFSGTIDVPEIYAIFPQTISDQFQPVCVFILEPANLEIRLDTVSLSNTGNEVSGGPFNEEFNRVTRELKDKFSGERMDLMASFAEAGDEEKSVIDQKIKSLNDSEMKYTTDYIESHPGSPVSVYLLMYKYFSLPLDELGHLLEVFSPEMRTSSVLKKIESDYQTQLEFQNSDLESQQE